MKEKTKVCMACEQCNSPLLYVKNSPTDPNKLTYKCMSCGHEQEIETATITMTPNDNIFTTYGYEYKTIKPSEKLDTLVIEVKDIILKSGEVSITIEQDHIKNYNTIVINGIIFTRGETKNENN